jgi:hypothetical protein
MNLKNSLFLMFLTFFSLTSLCQGNLNKTIVVGEKSISIPRPAADFVEATDELQAEADLFVLPNSNRLLALYTLKDAGDLSKKMCIQVSKSIEFYNIDEKRFTEFKQSIKPIMTSSLTEIVIELNNHLLTIEDIVGKINFGEMKMIATLFEDSNSIAFLSVAKVNTSNGVVILLVGMSSIKVNNRIIFAYVFNFYDNVESINWVSSVTNSWTKSIINANK